VLDEPTAVLTPQEVQGLTELMEDLRADGRSLIFITHKLDEALTIADDVTVLRDGKAVGTVAATETSEQELAQMMVGRNVPIRPRTAREHARQADLRRRGASSHG